MQQFGLVAVILHSSISLSFPLETTFVGHVSHVEGFGLRGCVHGLGGLDSSSCARSMHPFTLGFLPRGVVSRVWMSNLLPAFAATRHDALRVWLPNEPISLALLPADAGFMPATLRVLLPQLRQPLAVCLLLQWHVLSSP